MASLSFLIRLSGLTRYIIRYRVDIFFVDPDKSLRQSFKRVQPAIKSMVEYTGGDLTKVVILLGLL